MSTPANTNETMFPGSWNERLIAEFRANAGCVAWSSDVLKHAGPRTTVDLSLMADACRVHIVVHDSGPPDDEPAPAANRPERRFNSRLRSAR
ncbi:ATP-binding protein [Actinophytocola algeriensis]|uniref:Uncharacterized protein n=1 Tax=Actinophytocola algeriensis TaxID=1768010 RepID=A0A7W7Q866_9PSEU|nr:hypothetical protein [Actinophytocola algeriensis]MBB4908840.1 hypothetical protein [Actinophytocola algeriensis]MBE1474773.1 hypothetical protein [Actinophytocola algeriensis]